MPFSNGVLEVACSNGVLKVACSNGLLIGGV